MELKKERAVCSPARNGLDPLQPRAALEEPRDQHREHNDRAKKRGGSAEGSSNFSHLIW